MKDISAYKLPRGQCHYLVIVTVAIVFVSKCNLAGIVADDTMMSNGEFVSVSRQISDHTY